MKHQTMRIGDLVLTGFWRTWNSAWSDAVHGSGSTPRWVSAIRNLHVRYRLMPP